MTRSNLGNLRASVHDLLATECTFDNLSSLPLLSPLFHSLFPSYNILFLLFLPLSFILLTFVFLCFSFFFARYCFFTFNQQKRFLSRDKRPLIIVLYVLVMQIFYLHSPILFHSIGLMNRNHVQKLIIWYVWNEWINNMNGIVFMHIFECYHSFIIHKSTNWFVKNFYYLPRQIIPNILFQYLGYANIISNSIHYSSLPKVNKLTLASV